MLSKDMRGNPYQVYIRPYEEQDFIHILRLNAEEQWANLAERAEESRTAWKNRRCGIGEALLKHAHSLYPRTRVDLLASSSSKTYYEQLGFRPFSGFRTTMQEWKK